MQKRVTLQPSFDYKLLFKSFLNKSDHISLTMSNSGRSSFDLCLRTIKTLNKYKKILIPDLVCSEIIPIIQKHKLEIVFYSIDNELNPDINFIESNLKKESCILLCINYFGKSSDWKSIFELKKKYDFVSLEDNAHSLFGSYQGISYGDLGDISFNSLRKIIPVLSGSVLKYNKYNLSNNGLKKRFLSFTEFKYSLRNLKFYSKNKYSDTCSHDKSIYDDLLSIDFLSYKIFMYLQHKKDHISNQRKLNYCYWAEFLNNSDLEQIDLSSADCPYAAAYLYNDITVCNKWLEWGRINNINIIKWPLLPKIHSHSLKNKKLKNILLFPVNHMHDLEEIKLIYAKN